jgi:AcrR family transcriptional regulator
MLSDMESRSARPYRMRARAAAAAETGDRIVEAATELFSTRSYEQVGLEDVAAAADVSVRTVLRRYGTKDALFAESNARTADAIIAQRAAVPLGDVRGAVRNVLDHYEEWGDQRLLFLAQEHRVPEIRRNIRGGRAQHRDWVERAFGPLLPQRRGARRERQVMALIAATDVYTWKLLRRDWGLDREEAERTIEQMVSAVLGRK